MSGPEAAGTRRRQIVVAVIAIAATAVLVIGLATSRSVAAGPDTAPSPQATGNFAAYELGNLQGAFKRLGIAHPTQGDISLPDMIASVTGQPFQELNNAIKSKDATAFTKAYADLTDACNSCHQALNHGAVEIGVPSRTSASDLKTNSTSRN